MKIQPTTDRGRETVRRVLDAACVLFARQGIRATTLDQIGTLSGAGRGQLYHFFAGKSDLVGEVVAQQVRHVLDAQQPLLGSIATASDVRRWCAIAADQYADDPGPLRCPIGSLVHELTEQDAGAKATLAAGFDRWRVALTDGLVRVQAGGELAPHADPEAVAHALLTIYQGGVLLADATGSLQSLRMALGAVADSALVPDATG